MGLFDSILGRTKPAKPDLDQLFGLPSAALTLRPRSASTPPDRLGRLPRPRGPRVR